MEIVSYSAALHGSAVERFNARLTAGGSEFSFPTEEPRPKEADSSIWYEHFVATDSGEVFGGYLLKHQLFDMAGAAVKVDNLQLPLSLGQVDARFAHVSAALVFDALDRNELLYCLGMGSQDSKLVKLLTAAGWEHLVTPFYFRIRSANKFARNIRLPESRRWLQRALRMSGAVGLAGAGLGILNALRGLGTRAKTRRASGHVVPRFNEFADEIFEEHASAHALIGDRRAATLNWWYPETQPTFHRLVVKDEGRSLGWALLIDTSMQGHKQFGDLRVGTLADGFARDGEVSAVVAAADRFLSERGVDLIVTNQLHPAWGDALTGAGYRQGPSNYFFYFSRALAEALQALPDWERRIHINRGDGDGPIHL